MGRDTLLGWDKMCADLQQGELRQALLKSTINSNEPKSEEENVVLASKGLSQRQGEQKKKKKKDLSKVKCFRCGELSH